MLRSTKYSFLRPRPSGLWAFVVFGCLAVPARGFAAESESDAVISLPPLLVEERLKPLNWRYLELPRLEVLSLCDDAVTKEFVRRCHRLDQVLQMILPSQFQGRWSVPDIQILFNEDLSRAKSQELMKEMLRSGDQSPPSPETRALPWGGAASPRSPWQHRRVYFLPNMRLSDIDATAVFAAARESDVDALEFTFTANRIRYLLERRVPALPDWFVEGMVEFYGRVRLEADGISIDPTNWISDAETRALLRDDNRPRNLWPMRDLLAARRPKAAETADELTQIWRAQCALFVRWALVEDGGANREALWQFVLRLEREALNEALFRECFGMGFADARDRLSDFLPLAVARGASLRATNLTEPPELKPRAATTAEIARMRGEWERMQINYVKQLFPDLTAKYLEQARATLGGAYERGERDPRLLATIGLTEYDAGNTAGARAFLEAAALAQVVRPRVYVELARMRFDDAHAGGDGTRFTPSQVARVLEPLRVASTMNPALAETCAVMVETWSRSTEAPSREELIWLSEQSAKFSRASPLILRMIQLDLANGLVEPALDLARIGARGAPDDETREKFARIAARLTTEANPP